VLLVAEAGGTATGIAPDEDPLATGNILAANMELHPLIAEKLRAAG
jgi:myo-inositol-1(or 4)-monophosphatase